MKCHFILTALCLIIWGSLRAQDVSLKKTPISITNARTTLEAFFNEVEKQTPFSFFYTNESFDKKQIVEFDSLTHYYYLADYLQHISNKHSIYFRVVNNNIAIQKKSISDINGIGAPFHTDMPFQISGIITDEGGLPLPDVALSLAGSSKGVASDAEGRFVIYSDKPANLQIRHLGFQQQTIFVAQEAYLDITMLIDNEALEEVIVIGYGSINKQDFTGVVSSLRSEDLQLYPSFNAVELIQGLLPGVEVKKVNGEPEECLTLM